MNKTNPSISVLVPVHDPEGELGRFLLRLLRSLSEQTLKPTEVILISNHELIYEEKLKTEFSKKLNLVFLLQESLGAAENINNGVAACSGELVKILFQDDYLCELEALRRQAGLIIRSGSKWLVAACNHSNENEGTISRVLIPKFTRRIGLARNTIGAPSVVMFNREKFIPFDESLRYVFDCEWYLSMRHNFGDPVTSKTVDVTIGLHDGQATHWAKKLLRYERRYMLVKHWAGIAGKSINCQCSQRRD
jgi:glycosyltransferase involved in cell wall biosynthesis